ncbi:MAG: CHAT domain-containing protein [Acidimicrobiales bacterium]
MPASEGDAGPAGTVAPADEASKAFALASSDPRGAQALALTALALARQRGDLRAAAIAKRTMGVAAVHLSDSRAAITHLRQAIRLAETAGDPLLASQARLSLTTALTHAGAIRRALQEADRAAPVLGGVERAALEMQRASILHRLGRLGEAREGYQRALPVIRRSGDTLREARLLNNRGLFHLDSGDFAGAERDLRQAHGLFLSSGHRLSAAGSLRNLGQVAARRGDVPAALARIDEADGEFRALGVPLAFPNDRAWLLLSVRLVAEARECVEESVARLAAGRMAASLAEGRLILAETALLQGDIPTAREAADLALQAFRRHGRLAWAHLARYALLRIDWEDGKRSEAMRRAARRVADQLEADGWWAAGIDARLTAAQIALEAGRDDLAARDLEQLSRARRRGPVRVRAQAWHAEALLRHSRGDRRGAMRAVAAGLDAVEEHRATLGATELRVHASGHGEQLAAFGLRLAIRSARAVDVLRWAERWRARALSAPPVRPPKDPALAADQAELRSVVAQIEQAALANRSTTRLTAHQVRLERAIVERCRRTAATGDTPGSGFGLEELHEALGERALLELVVDDGALFAVVVAGGRCHFQPLGDVAGVDAEAAALRFALLRMATNRGSEAARNAAFEASRYAARKIEDILIAPVAAAVGERELVLVPTGTLHALPWSLLPFCADRAVAVAPSAALWQRAATGTSRTGERVVLVAGPRLSWSDDEVRTLASGYRDPTVLAGEGATASAVMEAMEGATMLHVAAHGTYRADNPLFSALQLFDGPLNVFDLEGLDAVPDVVVLAACESGRPRVYPGDELMGLASALLSLGARTLVACVNVVPDEAARSLMVAFHEELRRGVAPARALARARGLIDASDAQGVAAGAAFVCFGSG